MGIHVCMHINACDQETDGCMVEIMLCIILFFASEQPGRGRVQPHLHTSHVRLPLQMAPLVGKPLQEYSNPITSASN